MRDEITGASPARVRVRDKENRALAPVRSLKYAGTLPGSGASLRLYAVLAFAQSLGGSQPGREGVLAGRAAYQPGRRVRGAARAAGSRSRLLSDLAREVATGCAHAAQLLRQAPVKRSDPQ
jgi:hypothetical protein